MKRWQRSCAPLLSVHFDRSLAVEANVGEASGDVGAEGVDEGRRGSRSHHRHSSSSHKRRSRSPQGSPPVNGSPAEDARLLADVERVCSTMGRGFCVCGALVQVGAARSWNLF